MKKKTNKKFTHYFFDFFWVILVISFVVAFVRANNIDSVEKVYIYSKLKGLEFKSCMQPLVDSNFNMKESKIQCSFSFKVGDYEKAKQDPNWAKEVGLDKYLEQETTSNNETTPDNNVLNDFAGINIVQEYTKSSYNRKDWKHWSSYGNSSCWNTREEALDRAAEKGSVIYLDSNKKETKDKFKACSIKSGKWKDPYSNEIFTEPSKLDVDHTIALKAANEAGGNNMTPEMKEQYANDLDDVLVVTSAKQNRKKGAKTPSQWMPENKEVHCFYSQKYIKITKKYNLTLSQQDKEVLEKGLDTCPR